MRVEDPLRASRQLHSDSNAQQKEPLPEPELRDVGSGVPGST